jgi:hypothetical protein
MTRRPYPREHVALDLVSRGMADACALHTLRRLERMGFVLLLVTSVDATGRARRWDTSLTESGVLEAARGRIAAGRSA